MDGALTATTGVRLVLSNCTDVARDAEFNAWYDDYATSLTEPQFFVDAARYKDVDAEGDPDRPTYVSVYGITMEEPSDAWPRTFEWWEERGGHELTTLLQVPYRATYARIAGPGVGVDWQRLAVRLSDSIPGRERDAEEWFDSLASVAGRQSGRALTAYSILDGSPEPPAFLEILGTCDASVRDAYAAFQAELVDEARTERDALLRERTSGFFERVFSYSFSSTARPVAGRAKEH
jgi:hypothetical protein